MRRVIDIASKRGVRVQKVYGTAGYSDSNDDGEGTPRSRRMHLSLSGLQDAVLDVRQELQQFVDQVAQSVETLQVSEEKTMCVWLRVCVWGGGGGGGGGARTSMCVCGVGVGGAQACGFVAPGCILLACNCVCDLELDCVD